MAQRSRRAGRRTDGDAGDISRRGEDEHDERAERLAHFYSTRVDARGALKGVRYAEGSRLRHRFEIEQREIERRRALDQPAPPGPGTAVNWTPLGPTVVAFGQASTNPAVSGRITSLAVGPSGTRAYAGSANGGVWVTLDSGANWAPVDDYFVSGTPAAGAQADSLAVGAVAVQFGATAAADVIYVGTGESNQSADSYLGVGIRRFGPPSGMGAAAWTTEATNLAGRWISRLIVDTDTPALVYAATSIGLFRRPAAGGAAWTALTPTTPPASSLATDVAAASTGADRRYYVAYAGGVVWMLDPNTTTWTQLTGVVATAGDWVALAATRVPAAAATQRVVYALTQRGRLFRLAPGSTAFVEVLGMPADAAGTNSVVAGGQGWYDLAVEIEPGTADTVWVAGDWTFTGGNYNLALWRGVLTGTGTATPNFGFTNTGTPAADATYRGLNMHADGHAIGFPSNGLAAPVWVGCDGGVFMSTTGANGTFLPRNTGLAITEINYIGQRQDTDAVIFSGCQDNGTVRFRGEPAWFESPAGDGGGVTVDPVNQYRVMRQYVRTALSVATDGGIASGSWSALTFPPIGGAPSPAQSAAAVTERSRTAFYGPVVSSSNAGTSLAAFGTNRLWLTRDWGTTWVTLPTNTNPFAGAGTSLTQDVLDDPSPTVTWTSPGDAPGVVRAIAFASGTRIYAATRNAVWRYDDTGVAGAAFTFTALPTAGLPPGRSITGIAVADPAAGSLYVTLGGSASSHVFFLSGSAATTWTDANLNVSGTALDVPCHAAVVDPANTNIVFVASDIGVWRGQKTGTTTWSWTLFSQGLPEAAVTDIAVHARARVLRAATHGRGVWEIELDAATLPTPELYLRVNAADTGRLAGATRHSWVEGHQDPTRVGFDVWHWMSADIKVRRPSLAGLPTLGTPPNLLDFAINVGDYVDTGNAETTDPTTNRIFVQVHNRSLTSIPSGDVRTLLLITDAALGLPALPSGYAAHILAADNPNRPSGWLAGSQWWAGDATTPYRVTSGELSARLSRVVDFNVDLTPLALPATHLHVCAAAFATTISATDQLVSTESSLDTLTMRDRHAAHRNLHVVPAGTKPEAPSKGEPEPQTFILDIHNPFKRSVVFDVVFHRTAFDGELSMLLGASPRTLALKLQDWEASRPDALGAPARRQWARWWKAVQALEKTFTRSLTPAMKERIDLDPRMQRLEKLTTLVPTRSYVMGRSERPMLSVTLPANGRVTAAFTWSPPKGAKPGAHYWMDVVQQRENKVVGGSSYLFAVVE